jgi:probable rRNA maturation factor
MPIVASATNRHQRLRVPAKEVQTVVACVVRGERKRQAAVSVIFTDSRFIHRINRQFLRHDRPTDVIAFPLRDGAGTEDEIYVNLDYARRQAREFGVSMMEETRRLIIHGCLHLLGYRDHRRAERRTMREREERYLEALRRSSRG